MEAPIKAPDLEFRSHLRAPAGAVWRSATSLEGINDELAPLLRMTAPPGVRDLDSLPRDEHGRPRLSSVLLLGGWLPVDRMRISLVLLEEGRFVERSTLLAVRAWQHERSVEAAAEGCTVTDRLWLEPRVPGTGPLLRLFVRTLFRRRHARLRQRFGPADDGQGAPPGHGGPLRGPEADRR